MLPNKYVVECNSAEETNEVCSLVKNEKDCFYFQWKYVINHQGDLNQDHGDDNLYFEIPEICKDYPILTFKQWKQMKKTCPKLWWIPVNEQTLEAINKVRAKQLRYNSPINLNDWTIYYTNGFQLYCGVKSCLGELHVELTLEEFKSYFLEEEMELPEKWQLAVTNENKSTLEKWRKNGTICAFTKLGYINSNEGYWSDYKFGDEYTEITFEEFKKYVLKEKEFVLPKYWRILGNEESFDIVAKFFNECTKSNVYKKEYYLDNWFYSHNLANDAYILSSNPANYFVSQKIEEKFEEITLEQFKKHVLKKEKSFPEYWAIKCLKEHFEEITMFYNKQVDSKSGCYTDNEYINQYFHSHNLGTGFSILSDKPGANYVEKQISKKKDFQEISFEDFKKHILKKEPVKIEKWCILQNLSQEVCDWFCKNTNKSPHLKGNYKYVCYDSITKFAKFTDDIPNGYTEIDEEQFNQITSTKIYSIKELETNNKLVVWLDSKDEWDKLKSITECLNFEYKGKFCYSLTKNSYSSSSTKTDAVAYGSVTIVYLNQIKEIKKDIEMMQKLTIPIIDVLEIHKIACSDWKITFANYLTRVDADQNIKFTQKEVDEMFKAATSTQKPVLERLFGSQVKPIEWDKIKTGSKVMLQSTGNIITMEESALDFSKPFDVIFWKTPHSINYEKKFSLTGVYDNYCTFNQNGKFVKYNSNGNVNFVISVIEY